jgi:hypothetical protein
MRVLDLNATTAGSFDVFGDKWGGWVANNPNTWAGTALSTTQRPAFWYTSRGDQNEAIGSRSVRAGWCCCQGAIAPTMLSVFPQQQ